MVVTRERRARTAEPATALPNPARSVVKVRVYAEAFGVMRTVDLSPERHAELGLQIGDTVYVTAQGPGRADGAHPARAIGAARLASSRSGRPV